MSRNNSCRCSNPATSSSWIISLGSHKSAELRRMINAAGARLWYLPPYSSGLNPIEQTFAKIKHWMRIAKNAPPTRSADILTNSSKPSSQTNAKTTSPTLDTLQ
jgi:transposase